MKTILRKIFGIFVMLQPVVIFYLMWKFGDKGFFMWLGAVFCISFIGACVVIGHELYKGDE